MLIDELRLLRAQKQELEKQILEIEQSLLNEHRIEIEETLSYKPEPYGDITIGKLKFKVPKYVKWDNEKLEDLSYSLENPRDSIDVKLSISELKYNAMPEELKEAFAKARSVSSGKISVSLKE